MSLVWEKLKEERREKGGKSEEVGMRDRGGREKGKKGVPHGYIFLTVGAK